MTKIPYMIRIPYMYGYVDIEDLGPLSSGTIFASNSPSSPTVSSPTVTGKSNRFGPHDPGLK